MSFGHIVFILPFAFAVVVLVGSFKMKNSNFRLSTDVLPSEYNLTIRPYLNYEYDNNRSTFDGEVYVSIIMANKNVSQIILHSENLTYSLVEYYDSLVPHKKLQFTRQEIMETIIVLTPKEPLIPERAYILHFVYTGYMNDETIGLFQISYNENENNEKWLAGTQFQPTYARRVFPCFDEPLFKATFEVTIIREGNFKSWSNSRLIETRFLGNNTYADRFARTPIMPTYTLAFFVAEFQENGNENCSIVSRPEYSKQTNFILEICRKFLIEYNNYFDLPYHELGINKMHVVAVPDFLNGAMENWGLMIFNERYILAEPGVSTWLDKFPHIQFMAHELAHMWFGNLVTCEWWSSLWLNEGFARYFQYLIPEVIYPEWNMEGYFVANEMHMIFEFDSSTKNIPYPLIDNGIVAGSSRRRIFNKFAYAKGGCIIRMIRHAIGEEAFRKSLQSYLIEFKYKNVNSDNLLKHFINYWPNSSREYAESMFRTFTSQIGYPLVTVNVSLNCDSMEISQKRFLDKSADGSDEFFSYTIPISYTTNRENAFNATQPRLYLAKKAGDVTKVLLSNCDYVIANIWQTGYYRVNYNTRNWVEIFKALNTDNWGNISEINRAQLVDDLFNLAKVGEIEYNFVLGFMEYLKTETGYFPWKAALIGYSQLSEMLGTSKSNGFAEYMLHQIDKVYRHLGFIDNESDTLTDMSNRKLIVPLACEHGHPDCISNALLIFDSMNDARIPEYLRPVVNCVVAREGTTQRFKILYEKYNSEFRDEEKFLTLLSLGCVRDYASVKQVFLAIMTSDLSIQYKSKSLTSLSTKNPGNAVLLLKLIIENYENLTDSMKSSSSVESTISQIVSSINTKAERKKVVEILRSNENKFIDYKQINKLLKNSDDRNFKWNVTVFPSFEKFMKSGGNFVRNFQFKLVLVVFWVLCFYFD